MDLFKDFSRDLTPKQIKRELDEHIIGQDEAKKAIAIAMRSRIRRQNIADEELRAEITPRNILLIGPTGSGKTELARRIAKLLNAPFVKADATQFTETGYVGRSVTEIIDDLAKNALSLTKRTIIERNKENAHRSAVNKILEVILPTIVQAQNLEADLNKASEDRPMLALLRKRIEDGELNSYKINIVIPENNNEDFGANDKNNLRNIFNKIQELKNMSDESYNKMSATTIGVAVKQLEKVEGLAGYDEQAIRLIATDLVQNSGIVFIDEIDKTCSDRQDMVSRTGTQRELIPLIEGSVVETVLGSIKTDHILFICSGAFHVAKPSDLLPELQGRLPIKVELKPLTREDFKNILTSTKYNLLKQQQALLESDGVKVEFTQDALELLADKAVEFNNSIENIGARRLHMILEKLLEEINFESEDFERDVDGFANKVVNAEYVAKQLENTHKGRQISSFLL